MIRKIARAILYILAIVSCLALLINLKTHFIERFIHSVLYDASGTAHYLSCRELPELSEVEQVFEEHQDLVEEIKQVNSGFIFIRTSPLSRCPGKGFILIEYPSHRDRLHIEALLGDGTFFGIPYKGNNY